MVDRKKHRHRTSATFWGDCPGIGGWGWGVTKLCPCFVPKKSVLGDFPPPSPPHSLTPPPPDMQTFIHIVMLHSEFRHCRNNLRRSLAGVPTAKKDSTKWGGVCCADPSTTGAARTGRRQALMLLAPSCQRGQLHERRGRWKLDP